MTRPICDCRAFTFRNELGQAVNLCPELRACRVGMALLLDQNRDTGQAPTAFPVRTEEEERAMVAEVRT